MRAAAAHAASGARLTVGAVAALPRLRRETAAAIQRLSYYDRRGTPQEVEQIRVGAFHAHQATRFVGINSGLFLDKDLASILNECDAGARMLRREIEKTVEMVSRHRVFAALAFAVGVTRLFDQPLNMAQEMSAYLTDRRAEVDAGAEVRCSPRPPPTRLHLLSSSCSPSCVPTSSPPSPASLTGYQATIFASSPASWAGRRSRCE